LNVRQRDACRRIAHLFCELSTRFNVVDLVDNASFRFPISQATLGAAVARDAGLKLAVCCVAFATMGARA
jgi:hypothetical protein